MGSIQLTLFLNLNSAVGGVLQGIVVLFVLLAGGWQFRRAVQRRRALEKGGGPGAIAAELTATSQAAPVETSAAAE